MENTMHKHSSVKNFVKTQQFMAMVAMILLYLFFFAAAPTFRTVNVFTDILDASYYLGFMAIGVTFIIATGGIDLSLGTVLICSGLLGGRLFETFGYPIWVAILVTILIAIIFGVINGFLVAYVRLPAFIATLGTQMIANGIGQIASDIQKTAWPARPEDNGGFFRNFFRIVVEQEGQGNQNIPTGLILLLIAAVITAIVLNKAKTGRYILALGSNYEAARLSGINTRWSCMKAYIICGFFVGLGAIAFAGTYTTFLPGKGGGFELNAIAGVVIGGTSLAGGRASIFGTMCGILMMSILVVGLPKVGLQPQWQILITGCVIIAAVILDIVRNRKGK